MSVFLSRTAPVKTKEQKKVSRLANRTHTTVRKNRAPGPVIVVYKKADE